jgi:predicted transcriptional regulator
MALTAIARVERLVSKPPALLWNEVSSSAGLGRAEYDSYFADASLGHGIFLHGVERIVKPIGLRDLQEMWPGFHPPQSFRYVPVESIPLSSVSLMPVRP